MRNGRLSAFKAIGLILTLGVSMSACAKSTFTWKEEVLLHDGSKIIITRSVERGGRHEIGQEPPIKEQRLTFVLLSTNENVVWEDKFTEDVGGANFLPMQLEIRKDTAYLVVYPMGCLSYNKWGRPNPPYVVFKYQDKAWQRITLQELPEEFKIPNLIFSSPDSEAKKVGQHVVSAQMIKKLYEGYKQPEYQSILREPLKPGSVGVSCEELVKYKGYWIMPNDPVARSIVDRKTK
ncbi:MAG: hypothetical protein IDH49_15375 [Gammaproteobacteria bacterium]|nr:hypothetical protein [Gammaproteobacteria bacterium]